MYLTIVVLINKCIYKNSEKKLGKWVLLCCSLSVNYCLLGHCNRCVKFELNYLSLSTKNDFDRTRSQSAVKVICFIIIITTNKGK